MDVSFMFSCNVGNIKEFGWSVQSPRPKVQIGSGSDGDPPE